MEEEATEEFLGPQFHNLGRAPGAIVFVAKAYDAVADEDEALVGNGHPMGVAAEILQHLFRAAPRGVSVDDPRHAL
jgi:hypothetical protein